MAVPQRAGWILAVSALVVASGVYGATRTDASHNDINSQLQYGKPVRITLAWNNSVYEVTRQTVEKNQIGQQLGMINRQVSPGPLKSGDIARNTPEGPPLLGIGGGEIVEIKGSNVHEQVAVELSNDRYFRCIYLGKLGN